MTPTILTEFSKGLNEYEHVLEHSQRLENLYQNTKIVFGFQRPCIIFYLRKIILNRLPIVYIALLRICWMLYPIDTRGRPDQT